MKLSDILIGLGAFALLISLTLTFVLNFSSQNNIAYNSNAFTQINNSVQMYNQQANTTATSIGSVISSSSNMTLTENPLTALSTTIFNIIPAMVNIITYIPNFIINMFTLLPIGIPAEIIQFISYAIYIIVIVLIINWIRSGIFPL